MPVLQLHVSGSGTLELPVVNHVHSRMEKFIYADNVSAHSVALDYIESREITPANNLRLNNKTSIVPRNAPQLAEERVDYDTFYGLTYVTHSWEILATSITTVDEQGQLKPLFWKHVLPENTVEASIEEVQRGNRNQVDSGYKLDLDTNHIFTNYKNFFDADTGAYRLFYVVSTDDVGNTTHELLNPIPACAEAGWQDIDISTGNLYTTYPLYTRARGVNSNTFTFNVASQWYVRALSRALIQPRVPMALDANSNWFMRITNGDFFATTNGALRQYVIPEYWRQPFSPTAPYIFGSYEQLEYVNENILKFPRESTAVLLGQPLTIFIRDYDGNLLKVLTTDASLHGLRYGQDNVFYESDKILAVDNVGGFVSLGIKLLPSWDFVATYYYEADDYEYTGINLNPVYNSQIRNRVVVIYCKPDLTNVISDTSVYHIVVDDDGTIVDANEPGLALWIGGSPNPATVVGTSYGDFLDDYAVGGANANAYMLIVEAAIDTKGDLRDTLVYDVRQRGAWPTDDNAVKANPRLLQSAMMDNEQGTIIPRDNVVVIELPYSLQEDYGGLLTKEQAEDYAVRHLDASKLAVTRWVGPATDVTASHTDVGEITITWDWDGPGTYKVYRRTNPTDVWVEIDSAAQAVLPAGRTMQYVDTGLTIGVYHYEVRVVVDGVEYPASYSLAIEAQT